MSFHASKFGRYGQAIPADINGYVPTSDTGPYDLSYAHEEPTHDHHGKLTEYGVWWEDDGFPAIRAAAIEATRAAEPAVAEWKQGY